MPTPAEHRALLFVAAVAALGVGVRGCRAARDAPPVSDRAALARQIAQVDSAMATGGPRRKATNRPPAPAPPATLDTPGPGAARAAIPARIDLDTAQLATLDLLPGIGPALAARIVADREAHGPFGSVDGLQRVKGIGPALAARLQPLVTFSLPARDPAAARGPPARPARP